MLPLPPVRLSSDTVRREARSLWRRLDAYTLWAFNPQRPQGR